MTDIPETAIKELAAILEELRSSSVSFEEAAQEAQVLLSLYFPSS